MSTFRLILRSILHYWRTNLAVVLGVIVGTAVIGGALIVGDSVRDSLRAMTLKRLGKVQFALHGPRFFRQQLVEDMTENRHLLAGRTMQLAPAILVNGSVEAGGDDNRRRVTNANVVGLDDKLWKLLETGEAQLPAEREVVLGARVATDLGVVAGDELTLWVEIPESVPRETLLGERDEVAQEISATVSAVLEETDGASRFDLRPGQQLPMTVYLDLTFLQEQVGLDEVRRSRRNPTGSPARVNAIFVRELGSNSEVADLGRVQALDQSTQAFLRPADVSLRARADADRGYLSFESDTLILQDSVVEAAESIKKQLEKTTIQSAIWRREMDLVAPVKKPLVTGEFSEVLVYLANSIANARDDKGDENEAEQCYSSYSVIAGINMTDEAQFGAFEFVGDEKPVRLANNEILINEWLAEDMQVEPGDEVRVRYYIVGSEGQGEDGGLKETSIVFKVAGILKLGDSRAADPGFTPHVPGITDADSISDWEQPFAMDMERITERDDEYWEEHKTTPKAFINLKTAQKLFGSRHGNLSSLRVALAPDIDADDAAELAMGRPLIEPSLQEIGLGFRAVKAEGLLASTGANDFTGLFIGFSFFLIAAAAILIGLLFRLGIDRRTADVGMLSALGMTENRVRRVFLAEGAVLVLLGVIPGIVAAIAYASLMMYGLRTWWIGATQTRFLELSVRTPSLLIGVMISVVVSLLVVWLSVRRLRGYSAKTLLTGAADQRSIGESASPRRAWICLAGGLVIGLGLFAATLAGLIPDSEAFGGLTWRVVLFFILAIALLVAGVAAVAVWLSRDRGSSIKPGFGAMSKLGLRNAARHRSRSLFTVALIAFAAFVIVAVAAGRRNPSVEEPMLDSGNGGFRLVGETSQPVLHNLNSADGRDKLGFAQDGWPESVSVQQLRMKPGEDGSCLNLYQTKLPTVLGVPSSMIERGGFRFADTKSNEPWKLLNETFEPELVDVDRTISTPNMAGLPGAAKVPAPIKLPVYPAIGDMNTLQFSLKKGIGDTIPVPSADNAEFALKIVGMMDSSVFQGVLLMSEENFKKVYPQVSGYRYFLFESDQQQADQLSTTLETKLTPYGMDVERVSDRIAGFLAVQNTYLSTFQTLGGLGLLLGTFGLATVMLRNIIERRSELALMRSVGFGSSKLTWLVLIENAMLLLIGLSLGTGCALLAMTPHLTKTGADVPWGSLAMIIGSVFVVGMFAAWFAIREAVRTPILATLRSE
ncbi:MAG: FtsX-like permease family protein [Planctomycetaceae bacterium]